MIWGNLESLLTAPTFKPVILPWLILPSGQCCQDAKRAFIMADAEGLAIALPCVDLSFPSGYKCLHGTARAVWGQGD